MSSKTCIRAIHLDGQEYSAIGSNLLCSSLPPTIEALRFPPSVTARDLTKDVTVVPPSALQSRLADVRRSPPTAYVKAL